MQLHHQTVVAGHPGHLAEHVPPERGRARPDPRCPPARLAKMRPRLACRAARCRRRRGRGRWRWRRALEVRPPLLERGDVAGVGARVAAAGGSEPFDGIGPVRARRVEVGVRPEGRARPVPSRSGRRPARWWASRSEAGSSVVASTSMPNRSYSARGRQSGAASRSVELVVQLRRRSRPTGAAATPNTCDELALRASTATACRGTPRSGRRTSARSRAAPRRRQGRPAAHRARRAGSRARAAAG